MADGLLITMPNKQAHAALSILKQSRILAPDVTEVGAIKHVMKLIANSLMMRTAATLKMSIMLFVIAPSYVCAREHFEDLVQSHITTVSQFVNQPQCNQLAKFLTEIKMLRMNRAQSDESVRGPKNQTVNQSIK